MSLRRLHRRLAVLMGLASLLAFAGGAGFEPISALLAGSALLAALWWQPDAKLSLRLERLWLPLAAILVARALFHVFVLRDDVVIPVVDLLLLLLAAEALRSLEAPNDIRLYALSFALILASTAYRPGILFLLAFVSYVVLATLALTVGLVRRKSEAYGVRDVPVQRGLIVTTGTLSGVILLIAMAVFVSFPRVSQGWAGRGETLATSIAGFSDQISIGEHGSTIAGNPEIVLRVEFPEGVPANVDGLRWRGRSYDHFDGVRWTRSNGIPPSGGPTQWYEERWGSEMIVQKVYGSPLDVRVLFALHPAIAFDGHNGIQPLFDNAGDFMYWGSVAPVYTAVSPAGEPSPEDLREARRGYVPAERFYLQIPRLDPRIVALADSLTEGLDNRYDRAVAIESYLRSFGYTRDLPATLRETSLEHFLFERREGHCEYFSTAMVVLLRSAGVQARNVNGFLGGQWSQFGDYLVVSQNEAHSWVEVWFPGYGWVTFDPTPPGGPATDVATSWMWPGRIWFDGLQHRWNKWVLDYDVESQLGIFAGLFEERQIEQIESTGSASETTPWWAGGALAVVLLGGLVWGWARLERLRVPPTTSIYLQLRSACAKAGLAVAPGLTPLALAQRLRRERGAAAVPAERVVELYLRARYGGEELGEWEMREMREALGATRRLLRAP